MAQPAPPLRSFFMENPFDVVGVCRRVLSNISQESGFSLDSCDGFEADRNRRRIISLVWESYIGGIRSAVPMSAADAREQIRGALSEAGCGTMSPSGEWIFMPHGRYRVLFSGADVVVEAASCFSFMFTYGRPVVRLDATSFVAMLLRFDAAVPEMTCAINDFLMERKKAKVVEAMEKTLFGGRVEKVLGDRLFSMRRYPDGVALIVKTSSKDRGVYAWITEEYALEDQLEDMLFLADHPAEEARFLPRMRIIRLKEK